MPTPTEIWAGAGAAQQNRAIARPASEKVLSFDDMIPPFTPCTFFFEVWGRRRVAWKTGIRG
jgi:hypothetical protein